MGVEQDVENQATGIHSMTKSDSEGMSPPPEAAVANKPTSTANKNKSWTLVLVVAILAAIAVCVITIPIVHNNRNEESTVGDEKISTNDNTKPNTEQGNNSSSSTIQNSNATFFQTNGLFNSSIEVMSASVTEGYASEEELEESILNAVNFHLGIIYKNSNRNSGSETTGTTDENTDGQPENTLADLDSGESNAKGQSPEGSSFDTNNQEQGVEEGDLIVSDGNYVYAAYGKYLVVWNTAGAIVKSIEMPHIEMNSTTSPSDRTDMYYWQPEPYISSLLLYGGRLLVVVSGYEQANYQYTESGSMVYDRVLYNYLSTNIRLYETTSLVSSTNVTAESGLVGSKFVNGAWNAVRATNGIAQIVTLSSLNTEQYLVSPLQRYNYGGANISDAEYEQKVAQDGPALSGAFTRKLMMELKAGGDSLPSLARINSWQASHSENGALEEVNYGSTGLLTSLVLIHSLDMMSTAGNVMSTTSSGSFVPAYWVQVYGTDDKIILAANVYEYDESTASSKESTGLLAFDILGTTSKPTSVGNVPGYIINSYAMDFVGDTLRIATTVRNQTWTMVDIGFAEGSTSAETSSSTSSGEDPAVSSDVAVDVMVMPSEFETENFIIIMQLPTAAADTNEPGTMVEVGRLQIGKPQESITAIRFFDNIAYAVTFERTDPFYVLDLSIPTNPVILAELNITGFSSYLHPMNDEKTLLVAVGEEADVEGVSLGLQITIFNATDPRNPVAIHRHNIESDQSTYSYSDAQWDYKAFRYVDGYLFLPVDIGVDWMSSSTQQPFYGTMMFKVSADTGIEEISQCRVAHTAYMYDYVSVESPSDSTTGSSEGSLTSSAPCNYYAYLPRRSMVFNGDLMSIRDSEIIMTDLETCARLWNNTITISNEGGCNYRV